MTGSFNKLYAIHKPARTNTNGTWTETFTQASEERGRLSPYLAHDGMNAGQEIGDVTYRFSTRRGADISTGDRIVGNGVTVTVRALRPTSSGRRLECICEEIQDAG